MPSSRQSNFWQARRGILRAVNYKLYAMVDATDPRKVARLFSPPAWRMRKAGWAEYEVESGGADLNVEAREPVLIHGPASVLGFEKVVAVLRASSLHFTAELYEDAECVRVESAQTDS